MIENPIAATVSGQVQGTAENGLYVFKGIPFGASPGGRRRWLPPVSVRPWKGVRPAVVFGPVAPQNEDDLQLAAEYYVKEPQSEDCLYLNIWTPGLDDARRPVMVWIHGGAFANASGSSRMYSGHNLARRGNVVFVSINYRLARWIPAS